MFSVIMTDWSRCLRYKSENKATFPSQNRNTWLISVEIWASLSLSAVLMKFTKILQAKCRHRGCFKTRLIFHWEPEAWGRPLETMWSFLWWGGHLNHPKQHRMAPISQAIREDNAVCVNLWTMCRWPLLCFTFCCCSVAKLCVWHFPILDSLQ